MSNHVSSKSPYYNLVTFNLCNQIHVSRWYGCRSIGLAWFCWSCGFPLPNQQLMTRWWHKGARPKRNIVPPQKKNIGDTQTTNLTKWAHRHLQHLPSPARGLSTDPAKATEWQYAAWNVKRRELRVCQGEPFRKGQQKNWANRKNDRFLRQVWSKFTQNDNFEMHVLHESD